MEDMKRDPLTEAQKRQMVYEAKKAFVESLSQTLSKEAICKKIEYKRLPAQYEEFIKVTWLGDAYDYINVTADSCKAIFMDIARLINKQPPLGQVIDYRHKELIDGWWENAS